MGAYTTSTGPAVDAQAFDQRHADLREHYLEDAEELKIRHEEASRVTMNNGKENEGLDEGKNQD
ncbi:MAG: hypothetical protein V3W41_00220 [Planctomycetota bacterium]